MTGVAGCVPGPESRPLSDGVGERMVIGRVCRGTEGAIGLVAVIGAGAGGERASESQSSARSVDAAATGGAVSNAPNHPKNIRQHTKNALQSNKQAHSSRLGRH